MLLETRLVLTLTGDVYWSYVRPAIRVEVELGV